MSATPAITPARITDGSAPVSTTKNATVPRQSANRGQRDNRSAAPSAMIGASTIATFSLENLRELGGSPAPVGPSGVRRNPTGGPHP
jgi:hypothetical protein